VNLAKLIENVSRRINNNFAAQKKHWNSKILIDMLAMNVGSFFFFDEVSKKKPEVEFFVL